MGANNQHDWTEERTALLIKLLRKGASASEAAFRLGGVSRNAVIGKAKRLGIAFKRSNGHNNLLNKSRQQARTALKRIERQRREQQKRDRAAAVTQRRVNTAKKDPNVPFEPFVPAAEPMTATKTLIELEDGDCRWPIGDPKKADFGFCGREKLPGVSYCACHARMAFDTAKTREVRTQALAEPGRFNRHRDGESVFDSGKKRTPEIAQ